MKRLLDLTDVDLQSERRSHSPSSSSISAAASQGNSPHVEVVTEQHTVFLDVDTICYGSLVQVSLQIREDPLIGLDKHPPRELIVLEHRIIGDYSWFSLQNEAPFACASKRISSSLKRSCSVGNVEIDGLVTIASLKKASAEWRHSGDLATLLVEINIYGRACSANEVGDLLSSAKLFLQRPTNDHRSLIYDNPQYLKLPDVSDLDFEYESTEIVDNSGTASNVETSRFEIESILDHIPQATFLREIATSDLIETPLKGYQREAVDFMNRREIGDLPPSLSLWKIHAPPVGAICYKHVITGAKSITTEDIFGGILADDMGLGKTLSMLTVIVESHPRAVQSALEGTRVSANYWQEVVPSKATLVIVPSALLLDSWMEQVQSHIKFGAMSIHRYHALEKRISLIDLLKNDIVLTTYATIAADFCRGRSMLHEVEWYRVVLDEAHYIRNPSTKLFRAVRSLRAKIRWCLTGTPIQNSLEDLGALLKFLRVPILEDLVIFRKHISTPIFSKSSGKFDNLCRLLEALCLRRMKHLLGLPEPLTKVKYLELSKSEATKYYDFVESCKHAINLAVSGHSMRKANQHIIQAILGMRLFCNDGEGALKRIQAMQGFPTEPDEILTYLQTSRDATCIQCGVEITSMYQNEDDSSGVLTLCQHLVCEGCLPEYLKDLDDTLEDGRSRCPTCGLQALRSSFILEPTTRKEALRPNLVGVYPTKLCALLENVQNRDVEEKSIIFSFWKTTLDIVAQMFEDHSIPFYRIHGSIPTGRRSKILTEFEQSRHVRLLLITLGTGAVGLNKLKAANHVHIIEPQWNPSVENQAIGRILRFGQEKSVKITRYIIKNTIEEAVQSRQLRKLQLGHGGFGAKKDNSSLQRVQDVVNLITKRGTEDI